ncbi:hypothetical protein AKJ09_04920 [Labilithrix luteola]|uniref:Uncharacterized protein n=1 Tax=Labilithrix luteola TaxID=1391654 RepID=A0A0K1PY12_9BACT|nr:hypothetical protein AKJ09_04920 [Labilithrix luteola]
MVGLHDSVLVGGFCKRGTKIPPKSAPPPGTVMPSRRHLRHARLFRAVRSVVAQPSCDFARLDARPATRR